MNTSDVTIDTIPELFSNSQAYLWGLLNETEQAAFVVRFRKSNQDVHSWDRVSLSNGKFRSYLSDVQDALSIEQRDFLIGVWQGFSDRLAFEHEVMALKLWRVFAEKEGITLCFVHVEALVRRMVNNEQSRINELITEKVVKAGGDWSSFVFFLGDDSHLLRDKYLTVLKLGRELTALRQELGQAGLGESADAALSRIDSVEAALFKVSADAEKLWRVIQQQSEKNLGRDWKAYASRLGDDLKQDFEDACDMYADWRRKGRWLSRSLTEAESATLYRRWAALCVQHRNVDCGSLDMMLLLQEQVPNYGLNLIQPEVTDWAATRAMLNKPRRKVLTYGR